MRRVLLLFAAQAVIVWAIVGSGPWRSQGVGSAAAASVPTAIAQALDGRVFQVQLHVLPPSGTPAAGPSCSAGRIEGGSFLFAFRQQGADLQLALTNPGPGAGAPATDSYKPVTVDGAIYTSGETSFAFSDIDADGVPHSLTVLAFHLKEQVVSGDVVAECEWSASGSGSLDSTPPSVTFPSDCLGPDMLQQVPCILLNDSVIALQFSEPVRSAGLPELFSATASDGTAIPTTVTAGSGDYASGVTLTGFWPLGQTVTVRVAPGLQDQAGNPSRQQVQQDFRVVDDPGDLDAAGNSGFETGDLSGYTVNILRDYQQGYPPPPGEQALYLAEPRQALGGAQFAGTATAIPGTIPTEGQYIAVLGKLDGCDLGEVTLTARFVVPAGASTLTLDYNLVGKQLDSLGDNGPMLSLKLQTPAASRSATKDRPLQSELTDLDGTNQQTRWQQFGVPVDGLSGQSVVMTLRTRGENIIGPPPTCTHGEILLDNLRFE